MKRIFLIVLLLSSGIICSLAQSTFNGGWGVYKTGSLTRMYTYTYDIRDSVQLALTDSTQIFASPDSAVIMTINYSLHDKFFYKTTNYAGKNKLVYKSEHYKGNTMQSVDEWKYDLKNRPIYHSENSKVNGATYIKTYTYEPDNATGGQIITENAYYNGKVEFYTMDYYDRKNIRYKEIRLNDNKSATVHVETYQYDANGRLKLRQVYFPEFKVTKKFNMGNDQDYTKCFKQISVPDEVVNAANKELFLKRQLLKYKAILTDKDCKELEYILNSRGYKITVTKSKADNKKTVSFSIIDKQGAALPTLNRRYQSGSR
jgi:hypothetical protein